MFLCFLPSLISAFDAMVPTVSLISDNRISPTERLYLVGDKRLPLLTYFLSEIFGESFLHFATNWDTSISHTKKETKFIKIQSFMFF